MSAPEKAVEEKVDDDNDDTGNEELVKRLAAAGEPLIKVVPREPGKEGEPVFKKPPGDLGPHVEPDPEPEVSPGEEFEPPPAFDMTAGRKKLTELERAKVDGFEWRLKAHVGRVQMADDMAEKCREGYNAALGEWAEYCKSIGLDPERSFTVDEDGSVEYEKSEDPKTPQRYQKVNV